MRAGFATSVVLHAALLGFGLISLGAPKPLDAGATEALPVDIVPLEELTQIQEGDKTAALSDTPAPKPTTKPQAMPDAKNAGDNDADLEAPPTPEARPQEVKVASAPPPPAPAAKPEPPVEPKPAEPKPVEPQPTAEEKPAPKPEPVAEAKPEPLPAVQPETEPKPEAEAIEPAKPEEKKPEPKPAETAKPAEAKSEPVETAQARPEPEQVTLPDSAPSPLARPKPVETQTKVADAEPQEKASDAKQKSEDKNLEDQVALLLNKQKPSGGGAKRSQAQKASLGGRQTTGAKLSQGEMDALSGQLAGCWNIPAGMEGGEALRVSVRFNLDAAGKLDGPPTVDTSSGNPAFDRSAVRAVQKCDREGLTLPKDKADTWSEVVVNFDPSQMF